MTDASPPSLSARGRGRALLGLGARTVARRLSAAVGARAQGDWGRVGADWFATLSNLRGAAMKLGQIASQYSDMLPPALAEALTRLQASAQPVPFAAIQQWLDARWSPAQQALIARIEAEPIGVASIGQVHRAWTQDGRELAIKIQYPGVAAAIDGDVRNLGRLLGLARVLPLDGARLDELLEEVRLRLHEEVDYLGEAARMQRFAAASAGHAIVIPKVALDLCAEGVLAMHHEAASTLEQARQWPQAERDQLGATLLDWVLYEVQTLGEVHADPHPGNFGFRRDGTLVLYDFGCTRHIAAEHVRHFQEMTACGFARDYAGMHASMGRVGSLSRPDKPITAELEALYSGITEICMQPVDCAEYDFADGQIITDLRATSRAALQHFRAFKPVPELAFVARAFSGSYWLLRGLGARLPLEARFRAFAAGAA